MGLFQRGCTPKNKRVIKIQSLEILVMTRGKRTPEELERKAKVRELVQQLWADREPITPFIDCIQAL